jgi:uncharacterized protein YndB with AHSA1/START domain
VSRFLLITTWKFDAPIEAVWERITDSASFTEWWPGFERAEVRGDGGVGTLARYRVRGDFGLVFDLVMRVDEIREPELLRLTSRGGLVGTGEWRLTSDGPATRVTYAWDVEPSNRFLRGLSRIPALRRRMERSHDGVMEAGGRNLALLLEGQPRIERAAG